MTKPVMCLMISTTWIIVAVVSLPILVADELDVQAEELQLCPTSFVHFLPTILCRIVTSIMAMGQTIYLYSLTYQAMKDHDTLMGNTHNTTTVRGFIKKYKQFSITLLLIVAVNRLLKMLCPTVVGAAVLLGFNKNPTFLVLASMLYLVEYVNHPIAYGLMLREIYENVLCKKNAM